MTVDTERISSFERSRPARIIAFVLGVLLVSLNVVPGFAATPNAVNASAPTPTAEPALELVVIGDSIPFTGFCTDRERAFIDGYALRLEGELGRNVNVTNRSRNEAARLNQIADQVETERVLREQRSTADLAIISAGINDGPNWTPKHPRGSKIGDPIREGIDQILSYTPNCLDDEVSARADDFRRLFAAVGDLAPDGSPAVVVNAYNRWTG